ncbi:MULTISPECIES: BlaI/MecI/CopY family transcriptional regulator [Thermococcus]|uniref:Putative transcriptional regulator n=1 Tax=Thermococcus nautili TaxID=195522 RepID=W8NUE6_9EURY|nr:MULTISPECIES: BlaI/MecI/CopY family transcriptional regulator [Thermococcus]AHL22898.1 putative transcriptional regulator [Thermococcus nautili]NJE49825.1 CopY family transcriptional regulator [Thermococcus sp. 9N3]CAI1492979.1 Putative transcriptional regulator [Thermococcus nautili]
MEPHEFKLTEEGIKAVLPPLEAEIMEHMWKVKVATAGQVYEYMKEKHPEIRRSTISILMNRLCEKGLLQRSVEKGRGGMRYVYSITTTREEFEQKVVQSILDALMTNFREATYAYLSRIKK